MPHVSRGESEKWCCRLPIQIMQDNATLSFVNFHSTKFDSFFNALEWQFCASLLFDNCLSFFPLTFELPSDSTQQLDSFPFVASHPCSCTS